MTRFAKLFASVAAVMRASIGVAAAVESHRPPLSRDLKTLGIPERQFRLIHI